jgi:glycosyltransferase involved in cell wall biosynthesis
MEKRKIKIIHILHSVGGVDVSLRLILNNLDSDIFESIVIHGYEDTKEGFKNNKNKPITDYKTRIKRSISPINDVKSLSFILKVLKKEEPDLIHCHSAKGGILGKLASFLTKIPCYHTPQAYSYLSAESKLKRIIFLNIEKLFSNFNNSILASSVSERNRAINEVGYHPKKVKVFSNSIMPIEEVPSLKIPKTWPPEYICSVGRPSFQKNIELMVKIISELKETKKNIHLVLMGVGYHSPNLEKVKLLIEKYKLKENITLLEWTNRSDIFNIISNSQLYISTARYEGLPYSVIECLSLGKAAVVSDADGNRDLIENGKNGFVISNSNPSHFSEKINILLNDDSLRRKFENQSKVKFENEFDMKKNIFKLEILYKNKVKE